MNLVGLWFLEEETESDTLRGLFLYNSNQCFVDLLIVLNITEYICTKSKQFICNRY